MTNSCHNGVIGNDRNRSRLWAYQNNSPWSWRCGVNKIFLTFFKSGKIIIFSYLNSTNFNNNFKDNFVREKVNKMASKGKTLNISSLGPNEFRMT